jgi:malate dehydrogenase
MAEAIVFDRKRLFPCSALLQGEFGLDGVWCGVPCLIGRDGIERIVEIDLTNDERSALHKSAEAVRSVQGIV